MLTLGYYAEQSGYVNLVFDTRPNAEVDGEWTRFVTAVANTCRFPKWHRACEAIGDGHPVEVIRHDGTAHTLTEADGDEAVQAVFGAMLLDLLAKLRDDVTLLGLPLAPIAFMVVEDSTADSSGRHTGQASSRAGSPPDRRAADLS